MRVLIYLPLTSKFIYFQNILENLSGKLQINIIKPKSTTKYIAHLWSHFVLPFKKGNILFCPANTAPIFVPKSKKLVVTVHDVAFKTFSDSVSRFFYWYYSFLIPRNIKRADAIITISEASKKEILRFYPEAENKISVIPLGINEKYRILPGTKKEKQILYVGSMNGRKNLIGMIEAFEKLPENFGYKLVIVGSFFSDFNVNHKMNMTIERAKQNNNIFFKQGLDNEALIYEYNVSSCLVFPSFYEGFGLPPLEAMACGVASISTRVGCVDDLFDGGRCGRIIEPGDTDGLETALRELASDESLRRNFAEAGLKHVRSHYSLDVMIDRYRELYLRAARRART